MTSMGRLVSSGAVRRQQDDEDDRRGHDPVYDKDGDRLPLQEFEHEGEGQKTRYRRRDETNDDEVRFRIDAGLMGQQLAGLPDPGPGDDRSGHEEAEPGG